MKWGHLIRSLNHPVRPPLECSHNMVWENRRMDEAETEAEGATTVQKGKG